MKLALSSRLWESATGYAVDQSRHLQLTRELGYTGVELRYPLLPEGDAQIKRIADELRDLQLTPVFGPCAGVPEDDAAWVDATRVFDTLHALGAKWLKCLPISDAHVDGMTKLADLARQRDMILCTQLHVGTLTDTVDATEKFLKQVDHPALGLIFDPAHLLFADDPDVTGAVKRLDRWIEMVNLQCLARDAQSGDIGVALPGDPGATEFNATRDALAGRDLWWTVMPACTPDQDPLHGARLYRDALTE